MLEAAGDALQQIHQVGDAVMRQPPVLKLDDSPRGSAINYLLRLGVAVRIEDADAPQPLETAWAALGAENARSTGKCEVAGESGHEWTPRQAPAPGVERTACITDDGIVLRVSESGATLWEATSLQRGQQDAALFGVPTGYQLIDPQAIAEQVGQNMEQLDSVTGAQPTPQPAPAPRG